MSEPAAGSGTTTDPPGNLSGRTRALMVQSPVCRAVKSARVAGAGQACDIPYQRYRFLPIDGVADILRICERHTVRTGELSKACIRIIRGHRLGPNIDIEINRADLISDKRAG